jgi:cbb3-type cytochrome oxidase maturation protein
MQIIFIMIGISLVMALVFLGAFFWSMKDGQNDDLHYSRYAYFVGRPKSTPK